MGVLIQSHFISCTPSLSLNIEWYVSASQMFTTKALGQIVQEEAPEWLRPLEMVETPLNGQHSTANEHPRYDEIANTPLLHIMDRVRGPNSIHNDPNLVDTRQIFQQVGLPSLVELTIRVVLLLID